jgi:hypothetical protein
MNMSEGILKNYLKQVNELSETIQRLLDENLRKICYISY